MPRTSKSSITVTGTRRSTRLNDRQVRRDTSFTVEDVPKTKRRKLLKKSEIMYPHDSTICRTDDTPMPTRCKNPRRSQRTTPAELRRLEKALLIREQECKRKSDELNERTLLLSKREDEATLMLSQMAEREAQAVLEQLEEHFTCPLCYEIIAHPISLNPGQCGHTFCASCILKWFFSRLHRPCGGWHEPVDCPICRTHLVVAPERPPRPSITFPFVPNRIASSILESLVQKLARSAITSVIKKEDIDGSWESEACAVECVRFAPKPKDEGVSTDIILWGEGGSLRAEWVKKDRDGRRHINDLFQRWENLEPDDFIDLKHKFGV